MTARKILEGARKLLEDPARWTREAAARDADGWVIHPWSVRAQCWCLLGALCWSRLMVGSSIPGIDLQADDALVAAIDATGIGPPPPRDDEHDHTIDYFNDDPRRTHAEILAVLDDAIARCAP